MPDELRNVTLTVDRLVDEFLKGNHEEVLKVGGPIARVALAKGLHEDASIFRLHAVLSLIEDRAGNFKAAADWVVPWGAWVHRGMEEARQRTSTESVSSEEMEMQEARLRFVIRYAVSEYRNGSYVSARALLESCRKTGIEYLKVHQYRGNLGSGSEDSKLTKLLHASLLLTSVHYWESCCVIFRDPVEAGRGLATALAVLSSGYTSEIQRLPEAREANYVCARILLVLGLVAERQGLLRTAQAHIASAQILLIRDSGDIVAINRARLLMLTVERILSDDQPIRMHHIVDELRTLVSAFREIGHHRYECRALCALAQALVNMADIRHEIDEAATLAEASQVLSEAEQLCANSDIDHVDCMIQRVRILRKQGQFTAARDRALAVFGLTVDWTFHDLLHTQAWIARGHTENALGEESKTNGESDAAREYFQEAAQCFENAARHQPKNKLSHAQCLLQLVRVNRHLGKFDVAWQKLEAWNQIRPFVESPRILALGQTVQAELEREAFVLPLSEIPDTGAYADVDKKIKQFLLTRFVPEMKTDAAAAKLGVTRQTIHTWKTLLGIKGQE